MKNWKSLSLAALMLSFALPVSCGEVITTMVNWYSPIGQFNGNRLWMNDGYKYAKTVKNGQNYPLSINRLNLPAAIPEIGSPEFMKIVYAGAFEELQIMKSAGIDVVLYDSLPMPDYDPSKPLSYANSPTSHYMSFLEWLKAAKELNMKVGIFIDVQNYSGEYPKGYALNTQEWIKVIAGILDNLPADQTSLWKVNGVPAIIHFGTDSSGKRSPEKDAPAPDGGWRNVISELRKQGKQFYFIADMRVHIPEKGDWKNTGVNALYTFGPAGPSTFNADSSVEMKDFFTPLGLPYYFSISPGYYWRKVAYTEPDFKRIHAFYEKAVSEKTEKVHIMTWNDMGEDTDIWPSANKGDCLIDVFAYYNAWYKNGTPPKLAQEHLILAYPIAISDEKLTPAPHWGGGRWKSPDYAPKVFYWANLKEPRKLEIPGAGSVELPTGLSMGQFPSSVSPCEKLSVSINGKMQEAPGIVKSEKENLKIRYFDLLKGKPAN